MYALTLMSAILLTTDPPARDGAGGAPREIRVAVCQILGIDGDREGNFRRVTYALEEAARNKADVACFPESILLGWENPDAHRLAAPIPGKDSERLCALARQFKLMIAIGLDEKAGEQLYDSAVLIDNDGRLLLKHRKLNVLAHLMEPPYAAGKPEDISVVQTRLGRIGVLICADTFVEEHVQRMAALKPDLVLVPYGWAARNEEWPGHAKSLEGLVCRIAKAWNCPVVGTDLVGAMSQGPWRGRTYGGASVVADAAGKPLAVLKDRDVEVRLVMLRVGREK